MVMVLNNTSSRTLPYPQKRENCLTDCPRRSSNPTQNRCQVPLNSCSVAFCPVSVVLWALRPINIPYEYTIQDCSAHDVQSRSWSSAADHAASGGWGKTPCRASAMMRLAVSPKSLFVSHSCVCRTESPHHRSGSSSCKNVHETFDITTPYSLEASWRSTIVTQQFDAHARQLTG